MLLCLDRGSKLLKDHTTLACRRTRCACFSSYRPAFSLYQPTDTDKPSPLISGALCFETIPVHRCTLGLGFGCRNLSILACYRHAFDFIARFDCRCRACQVVRPRGLGCKEEHSGRSIPGRDEPQKRLLLRKPSPAEALRYVRLPDSGRRRPHHGRFAEIGGPTLA